jgi:hypothetical protein
VAEQQSKDFCAAGFDVPVKRKIELNNFEKFRSYLTVYTHSVFVRKTSRLMPCREIIALL